MIRAMDELLQRWADELHSGGTVPLPGGGGNIIALLIATRGELVRGGGGPRDPWDRTADVELIYNKHLPDALRVVVHEHYLNRDSLDSQKLAYCGLSRAAYYRRLHEAHEFIQSMLLERAA
ncbi:hypothetical protein [Pseudomonas indica]|uniref:Phage antitermination protein Q n=1 Tax=Pseudomonas indica TaxID=137658 RepID=A0A1G8V688_9PSED|nr:hypothetical protein [Pseudomonas indica]SDJ60690.1 hypothetical protein SAMN05216186_10288 [Pseudomonas indica]